MEDPAFGQVATEETTDSLWAIVPKLPGRKRTELSTYAKDDTPEVYMMTVYLREAATNRRRNF